MCKIKLFYHILLHNIMITTKAIHDNILCQPLSATSFVQQWKLFLNLQVCFKNMLKNSC